MTDPSFFLSLTEGELLEHLDREIHAGDDFLGDRVRASAGRGREWLQVWVRRNREALCDELRKAEAEGSDPLDGLVDIATLVDIIAALGLHQPTATLVSAILVKWGVQSICA